MEACRKHIAPVLLPCCECCGSTHLFCEPHAAACHHGCRHAALATRRRLPQLHNSLQSPRAFVRLFACRWLWLCAWSSQHREPAAPVQPRPQVLPHPCMPACMRCPVRIPSLSTCAASAPGHTEARSSSSSEPGCDSISSGMPSSACEHFAAGPKVRSRLLVRSPCVCAAMLCDERPPLHSCADPRRPRTTSGRCV